MTNYNNTSSNRNPIIQRSISPNIGEVHNILKNSNVDHKTNEWC